MYRIGVDVGGTNTDSAILDITQLDRVSRGVLATCKTPTTANVTDGIKTAIEKVLSDTQVDKSKILNVAVGTTHFVNAVLEQDVRRLSKVAVLRLCGPYTRKNPPFCDFPYSLRDVIEGPHYYLDGGLEIDGREITPLNPEQIKQTVAEIENQGIHAVAVVGVFSALDHAGVNEEYCKKLIRDASPDVSVTCSHTIGGPGLLERENATILNASILEFAKRTVAGFRRAMKKLDLKCPLYVTQNDGTLADAASAAELPVKTFASGPTNSLMGAAFLQGLGPGSQAMADKQVIVVDIGGTTSDICGLLPSGFPRQAPNFVEVGGVRTAFSMPEVFSIALGGGSRVRIEPGGNTSVGPDSVADRLRQDALVFGGGVLTTTDIMVASGSAQIGDTAMVQHVTNGEISKVKSEIKRTLEKAIDTMKVSSAPVVILLVGGGSILISEPLDGLEECLCPPHHDSANAVGAAIAKVSGEVDVIEILQDKNEDEVFESIKQRAVDAAIARGADQKDVHIADVQKLPLQYVTNKSTRFVIKAVGSLKVFSASSISPAEMNALLDDEMPNGHIHELSKTEVLKNEEGSMGRPTLGVDLESYRPNVKDSIWHISPVDVELIASGTGVLGTGGGGSSYNMALYTLDILRKGGKIRVIDPESLRDEDVCVFGAGYGAPSVSNERLASGQEVFDAVDTMNNVMGIKDFAGIVADEIGGGNGLVTFPSSAHYDRPVVDCDLMGRAYPTLEHGTPYVHGQGDVLPVSTADGKGNVVICMNAESHGKAESIIRNMCIELGNSTAAAARPLSGKIIKGYSVPRTVSLAWYLGRAVHLARQKKIDFIDAIGDVTPVKLLYSGKIVDVQRDVSMGYTVGRCVMAPLSTDEGESTSKMEFVEERHLIVPFQNEYLAAGLIDPDDPNRPEEMICTVPDLISILGQDGEALGSPELRYGLRVKVIGMPAHPLWSSTPNALRVGGPEFFKLGVPWTKIGEYRLPRSVIEEFNS